MATKRKKKQKASGISGQDSGTEDDGRQSDNVLHQTDEKLSSHSGNTGTHNNNKTKGKNKKTSKKVSTKASSPSSMQTPERLGENTYWLTRIIFVRMVCFLYLVAFLVAYNQVIITE